MTKDNSFTFKDITSEELSKILDNDHPITLKYNEDIVNRIHKKYSILSKVEVAIIVKTTLQSMRELLILGKTLKLRKFFDTIKLFFYRSKKYGYNIPFVKVKIKTPPRIRNTDHE